MLSAPSGLSQCLSLQLGCWEKPGHVQEGPAKPSLEALPAREPGRDFLYDGWEGSVWSRGVVAYSELLWET